MDNFDDSLYTEMWRRPYPKKGELRYPDGDLQLPSTGSDLVETGSPGLEPSDSPERKRVQCPDTSVPHGDWLDHFRSSRRSVWNEPGKESRRIKTVVLSKEDKVKLLADVSAYLTEREEDSSVNTIIDQLEARSISQDQLDKRGGNASTSTSAHGRFVNVNIRTAEPPAGWSPSKYSTSKPSPYDMKTYTKEFSQSWESEIPSRSRRYQEEGRRARRIASYENPKREGFRELVAEAKRTYAGLNMGSQRPKDVSPDAMQARIQKTRREIETLRERIRRNQDQLEAIELYVLVGLPYMVFVR